MSLVLPLIFSKPVGFVSEMSCVYTDDKGKVIVGRLPLVALAERGNGDAAKIAIS
jgi:hypothetical protein